MLPLSYISFGVALTEPWTWPQKFHQAVRDKYNDTVLRQQNRQLENNLTRQRLNEIADAHNHERTALQELSDELDRVERALRTGSRERLPQFERNELIRQQGELEAKEQELQGQVDAARTTELENLRTMLQADTIEQKYNDELSSLRERARQEGLSDEEKAEISARDNVVSKRLAEIRKLKSDFASVTEEGRADFGRRYSQYLETELSAVRTELQTVESKLLYEEFLDNAGYESQETTRQYLENIRDERTAIAQRREVLDRVRDNVEETRRIISSDQEVVRYDSRTVGQIHRDVSDTYDIHNSPELTIRNAEELAEYNRSVVLDPEIEDFARNTLAREIASYTPEGTSISEKTTDTNEHFDYLNSRIYERETKYIEEVIKATEDETTTQAFRDLQRLNQELQVESDERKRAELESQEQEARNKLEEKKNESPEARERIERYEKNIDGLRGFKEMNEQKRQEVLAKINGEITMTR